MKRESTEELRARLLADAQVHSMIAMRAYEIFELRGGTPGHEAEDWFQAESEILKFVIEEEYRQSDTHSSREESAPVEGATPPFTHPPPYDTTEKGMEIFISVETEATPSGEPLARAASAGGGTATKRAAPPEKTSSSESSTNSASPSKKAAGRLKASKGSDKKASGKVKAPKKAGKTKQSKHRSAELKKDK